MHFLLRLDYASDLFFNACVWRITNVNALHLLCFLGNDLDIKTIKDVLDNRVTEYRHEEHPRAICKLAMVDKTEMTKETPLHIAARFEFEKHDYLSLRAFIR